MNISIRKKVGDFALIEGGSIVLNQSNNVSFFFADLEIEIVFNNSEEKKQEVKAIPIGGKKLQLQIFNFDNPLGTGPKMPMSIATLNTGEEIYLQYVIYSINEIKVIHYSWYTKNIINGNSVQFGNDETKI